MLYIRRFAGKNFSLIAVFLGVLQKTTSIES